MKSFSIAAVMILLLGFSGPVSAQLPGIDGEWTLKEGMMSGQDVPEDILSTMRLSIKQGTFDAKSGESMSKGKVMEAKVMDDDAASGTSSSNRIVFKIAEGSDAGREVKAIWELKNRNLKIAYSQGDDYPTEFVSTADNRNLVLTYIGSRAARRTASNRSKKARPRITISPVTASQN